MALIDLKYQIHNIDMFSNKYIPIKMIFSCYKTRIVFIIFYKFKLINSSYYIYYYLYIKKI